METLLCVCYLIPDGSIVYILVMLTLMYTNIYFFCKQNNFIHFLFIQIIFEKHGFKIKQNPHI